MSLDIVRPEDVPPGKIMFAKDENRSLMTEDIPTAKPTYHHLKYLNKPDLSVGCNDPEHVGGRARTLYAPMDRRVRDLSLTTADIERAQPRSGKKTNRHTDPLCPNYELPTCYKREPTLPRGNGRDTMDVSDIELSKPKKMIPERNYVRDPNEGRDIEFASANYQERMARKASRGPRQDRQHDVQDITGTKQVRARCTNPLDPVYKVPTHATTSLHNVYTEEHGVAHAPKEADEIGEVHGSKPRKLQWDNGEPHFSLLREDIPGTIPQRWVGSVPANIYDHPEARPMISFHDPHDIPGAQVGSLKKGIEGITRRSVNPLNPRYPMLDGDGRPPPVPLLEAERGNPRSGLGAHPVLQNRTLGSSSSAPSLRTAAEAVRGGQSQYMPGASGSMQREFTQATLRDPPSDRQSRMSSGRATPASQQGAQYVPARRFDDRDVDNGVPMSRRSSASMGSQRYTMGAAQEYSPAGSQRYMSTGSQRYSPAGSQRY